MVRIRKASLHTQALTKALLLPLALAACLALPGNARAQQCQDVLGAFPAAAAINAPDPAVRFAVMDLVSRYNWARDDQVSAVLAAMFTDDVVYELCAAGGSIQIESRTGPIEVVSYLGDLSTFLNGHNLRTRHFVGNQLFHQDPADEDRVLAKMAVLVLLQPAYPESPVLDYTATLKAEFLRDANGDWKFNVLINLGDTPAPPDSAARGR